MMTLQYSKALCTRPLLVAATALVALPVVIMVTSRSASAHERPNILYIITDNQPYNVLGCAGNKIIKTPNIDSLAERGTQFTNAFVTSPICAASRASLLTGLYERTHQFTFRTPPFRTEYAVMSFPALLHAYGYRTGYIGKFGLGVHPNTEIENEEETIPKMYDVFDHYHFKPHGYLIKQEDGSEKHLTDLTEEKAIAFLRDSSPNQPFCLTVSFNAPHALDDDPRQYIWPQRADGLYEGVTFPAPANSDPAFFEALPEFIKTSESRRRWYWRFDTPDKFQQMMRGFYRMVTGVDMAIGSIVEAVDRLGMKDNTVVIFMSDNGMFFGQRGLSDCWLLHEESIRVPLIIVDPRLGKEHNGATVQQLVLNIDIAPTICEMAGVKVPSKVQGHSLRRLIRGESPPWRTEFFCEHLFESPPPGAWKDSADPIPKSEGVRTERYKYIRYFQQQPVYEELYDLEIDRYESHNVAGNPKLTQVLKRLRCRCDYFRDLY